MKAVSLVTLLVAAAATAFGQLSTDQKLLDFQQLAGQFAKGYAPHEWKRDMLKADLYNIKPWLDKVQATKSDLEFYEICAEYVASLQDVHSEYYNPSSFFAFLGVGFDIYDGKVLVESITRSRLPASRYPFQIGDELVSIDGQTPADFIKMVNRFQSYGNPRSTDRWSASYLGFLEQWVIPKAVQIGETARVIIRRQDGSEETYQIPWVKSGRPLVDVGPLPTPKDTTRREQSLTDIEPLPEIRQSRALSDTFEAFPPYVRALLRNQRNVKPAKNLRGFGSSTPVFTLPTGFARRSNAFFYDGVYQAQGKRIGFIRIGVFDPVDFQDLDLPIATFEREIAYMQANTDGLVIDIMRNPGGYGCYAEELLTRLIPNRFTTYGEEIRPTIVDVNLYFDMVDAATSDGSPDWLVNLLKNYAVQVETAYKENRGLTGPLPGCSESFERDPATDTRGNIIAYTKPIVLLTDEFTTSAGDIFAAVFQDAGRGPLFGYRTAGAGGSVEFPSVGVYSEGQTGVTRTLLVRPKTVDSPWGPTRFIENVGVTPDIQEDYMTRANLLNNGADFVQKFTQVIVDQINKNNQ